MIITAEILNEKMKHLKAQEEQATATLLAARGAIELCENLLQDLNKPEQEALTIGQLGEMLGAKEIGEPQPLA